MTLLAIDGLNIVRRIHEAIPVPDSPEKVVGTIKSSISSFRRALQEVRPTHAVAAFDFGGKNWRHDLYPDYKKSRKPMPVELKEGLPELIRQIESIGIPCVSIEGVEADDVIAGLRNLWLARTTTEEMVVMSTDKDLGQLLADSTQVRIRDHFTSEWRDADWFRAKFGVPVELLGDLFALMGDKTDDIPGVEKCGPKTAAAWLAEYGNLEGVLANADKIKGKIGDNLRRDIELAKISRQLVSFKTDFRLGLTWKMLERPLS